MEFRRESGFNFWQYFCFDLNFRIVFFLAVALTSSALIIERTEVKIFVRSAQWQCFYSWHFVVLSLGIAWQILGGRCVSRRNSILTCCYPVRGDVRTNGSCARFYDFGVWRHVQRQHFLGHRYNIATGNVWNVLRFCNIGHLWTWTKRYTVGAGLVLSDPVAVRCHMANWRNAIYIKVSVYFTLFFKKIFKSAFCIVFGNIYFNDLSKQMIMEPNKIN